MVTAEIPYEIAKAITIIEALLYLSTIALITKTPKADPSKQNPRFHNAYDMLTFPAIVYCKAETVDVKKTIKLIDAAITSGLTPNFKSTGLMIIAPPMPITEPKNPVITPATTILLQPDSSHFISFSSKLYPWATFSL